MFTQKLPHSWVAIDPNLKGIVRRRKDGLSRVAYHAQRCAHQRPLNIP